MRIFLALTVTTLLAGCAREVDPISGAASFDCPAPAAIAAGGVCAHDWLVCPSAMVGPACGDASAPPVQCTCAHGAWSCAADVAPFCPTSDDADAGPLCPVGGVTPGGECRDAGQHCSDYTTDCSGAQTALDCACTNGTWACDTITCPEPSNAPCEIAGHYGTDSTVAHDIDFEADGTYFTDQHRYFGTYTWDGARLHLMGDASFQSCPGNTDTTYAVSFHLDCGTADVVDEIDNCTGDSVLGGAHSIWLQ